jgi:hypothetical protein
MVESRAIYFGERIRAGVASGAWSENKMKLNTRGTPDAELCAFVASLPSEQLHWLLVTPPLGDNILDHAVECAACAGLVQAAGKDFFMSFSPKNRARISATTRSARAQYDAVVTERGTLDLAASDSYENVSERPPRVEIAAFKIQGVGFEAFEDPEGNVYLRGPVPSGAKEIYFGTEAFALTKSPEAEEVKVENLGSIDLEKFLGCHQDGLVGPPVRWSDEQHSGS